jgi:hypothetical protein
MSIKLSYGQIEEYEARMVPLQDSALVLARDITAHRRAEREWTAMQEQIIQAQQAALRELSTPLMPIADGVVVMPLIGVIDSARAQQIMESLLHGVSEYKARVALIDITGVKVVDTQGRRSAPARCSGSPPAGRTGGFDRYQPGDRPDTGAYRRRDP